MNRSSAEQDIRAALRPKPKIPDKDFLTMSLGSVAVIAGVECKLLSLNRGKRRMTFSFGQAIGDRPDFTGMQIRSIVKVLGVYCRLERVDRKKGRWTFTPTSPVQVMPLAEMANPIQLQSREQR